MTAEEQGATPEEAPKTTTSLWDTLSAASGGDHRRMRRSSTRTPR